MSFDEAGGHSPASIAAMALFALVWLGLAANIRKIAGRTENPPSFHPVLNAAHLGRFAGWALVGAAIFRADPWTGAMLMVTRVPAVALVGVTFLQRRTLRPSTAQLLGVLGPGLALLLALCAWLALDPPTPRGLDALRAIVAACFAVQAVYALPDQIRQARHKPLGNLRFFQLALLVNYAWMLIYSFWVQEAGVQLLMRVAYGVVVVEQAMLVFLIERGVRARRRST